MSFITNAFKGATNDFTPMGGAQSAAQATGAYTNYTGANTGLNNLASMLANQANGLGPNLANQQLQNATAQNVSNQAALMAGQRGASSNVGLMGRQIANQGAQIQQQAAGQAAANRLQEQLQAEALYGQTQNQIGQLASSIYGGAQGAVGNANKVGAEIGGQNAQMNQGLIGGIANTGAKLLGMADGGTPDNSNSMFPGLGKGSNFGFNFVNGKKPASSPMAGATDIAPTGFAGADMGAAATPAILAAAKGGGVDDLPFIPHDYRRGGEVKAKNPAQKAVVPGNSYKNDKIPALMSEGEVVLPREVTQSPNAPQNAARFMSEVMAGKHRKKR